MAKTGSNGTRFLRFIWGSIPWLLVALMITGIIKLYAKMDEKKTRLEEERKAAVKTEIPAVDVITQTLKPGLLKDRIDLPAEVEPFQDLWVKAEVPGQVVNVLVAEGQDVEAGQILIELDDLDYAIRIEQIQANYNLAGLEYNRLAGLAEKKIAPASSLDQVEAQKRALAAQLKEAELALSRTRITAPISGRINSIEAKAGDWIGAEKPVAQILQMDRVNVVVGVPESDVEAVLDLEEAEIRIDALDGLTVIGQKLFLASQAHNPSRLYDLELIVPNWDKSILPGMFARVQLVREVYPKAFTIPLYTVITEGDMYFVYVEKNGVAEKRSVELGILDGWQIHVKSGLVQGDNVIIVGHRLIDHGQKVMVIKNVTDPREILE